MAVDRYTKSVLTIIAIALTLIALSSWLGSPLRREIFGPVPAEAQGSTPQFENTIPKAWGKVIGYSPGNVLLEAPDGVLREVDIRGSGPEYPKVKVLARWN
jgi:hypothetical protein